jgi:hypothetical protein
MNWRDKLAKWCADNPPPPFIPLELRDTSGSMSRETMSKFAEDMEELIASGEIKLVYVRMDDEDNMIIEDEHGFPL